MGRSDEEPLRGTGEPPPFSPGLACGLAIAAVSSSSVFVRLAQEGAPSLVVATGRLVVATLLTAGLWRAGIMGGLGPLARRDVLWALVSGGFLALHFGTWIASLEFTSVASSVALVSTSPVWVVVLSPWFHGDRLAKRQRWGAVLATVGAIVIALAEVGGESLAKDPWLGNGLALAGALAVSGYFLIGRDLRRRMSLPGYTLSTYGSAALILLAATPVAGEVIWPQGITWLWISLLALVPQILGHSTFNWALRYLPATNVAVLAVGETIGATLLAWASFGESPRRLEILGAAVLLAGIWVTTGSAGRPRPRSKETPEIT